MESNLLTRRQYLIIKSAVTAYPLNKITWVQWLQTTEAVASVALEHPEWDMNEVKTFIEWEEVNNDTSNNH